MHNGSFASAGWDLAIMFPMLEMCYSPKNGAKTHSKYIWEILYIYRVDNPISDHRICLGLQKEVDAFIRTKEPYGPVESLG